MTDKMLNPIVKKFKIELLSWLHIWWSKDTLQIWWIDSPVIKNPINWEPFIPWSTIKWKMRAMLEMIDYSDDIPDKNWPVSNPDSEISKSFWCSSSNPKVTIWSRLLFEDFTLNDEWKEKFEKLKSDFFEDKAENTVPRFYKWNANPRHIERVPAWVVFEWRIVLTPVEWDYWINENELINILNRWIELLNKTYIWWWGSRWNWRILMVSTD